MVLFGTAFVLKHLLVSALYAADGGWLRTIASTVLRGISIEVPAFAPGTGYISFFALVFYVMGLLLIRPVPPQPSEPPTNKISIREEALRPSSEP
jgi:hypothetical protein